MYYKIFLESFRLSGKKSMIDLQNRIYGPGDDDEDEDEDEDWEYEDDDDEDDD